LVGVQENLHDQAQDNLLGCLANLPEFKFLTHFGKGLLERLEKPHFASDKSWYRVSSYQEIYLRVEPSCEVFP